MGFPVMATVMNGERLIACMGGVRASRQLLSEAAQAVVEQLAFSMMNGASPAEIGGPMALAKVECTTAYEYCAREASQILGGASFVRQGKGQLVERLVREVRVNVVGGGSEEIMLDLAMRMSKI